MAIYPYVTEFIARKKKNYGLSEARPFYDQQLGYSPMMSQQFSNVSPQQLAQLVQNFPFFFMIILLIPFYYIVQKLASEKESKAREGMKMMGLNDSTYYLAWFIFYFAVCTLTSIILTFMAGSIFKNVDMVIYFVWTLAYALSLYG